VARTTPPGVPKLALAAPPLPEARPGELPAEPHRDYPAGLHLHFHRVDAAGVAAIIWQQQDGPMTGG
jgi:hypothetical protein